MKLIIGVTRVAIALVLIAAGIAKLYDLRTWPQPVSDLRTFGVRYGASVVAITLPILELAIAGALLTTTGIASPLAAALLFTSFAVATAINLARGRRPDCNCF